MINKLPRLRKKVFDISQGPHRADQHLLRQVTKREREEGTHRAAEGYRLLFDRNPAGVFRTLFEESTDGIAITTPGGEFSLVNQPWLDLFGYTREEITELNIAETYVQAHDRTALRQRIEQRGSAKHCELKLRKKDGKQMDCLLAMKVWRAKDGSILGYQSIVRDITDRKQTEKSLRDLSGRLLCLQDEERRLARELHDATGQSLAALTISLTQIKQSGTVRDPRLHKLLLESLELAGQSAREIRTLSYLLHPPLLDELGLTSALYYYAEGFAKRSGIHLSLDVPAKLGRLPRELETTVFRIVQESLTNIHRHSRSATARIRIVRNATDLTLEVSDEGNGMSPAVLERSNGSGGCLGVGIAGMRERARQLGGQLAIDASGRGVKVRATLPLSGGQ